MLRHAEQLLVGAGDKPVRFSDIFESAGVSRGSAYRIYNGMDDLLQDLAGEWLHNFVTYLGWEDPPERPERWMDLSDYLVERASRYWNQTAETLQVMPGMRASSQASYRAAARELSDSIAALFDRYFEMPHIPAWRHKIGFYTQICDVAFTDAVRATGYIDEARITETQALCRTQLSFYLPSDLPPREQG